MALGRYTRRRSFSGEMVLSVGLSFGKLFVFAECQSISVTADARIPSRAREEAGQSPGDFGCPV
jgi:hypothetical protein